MYMYAIYSIKLICIDTFEKQIKIQLELLKMFESNSSTISALHFEMSLAWDSLANSRHPLPLATKFIRYTLSLKEKVFRFDTIFY